jgi:hypothetical protein
VGPHRQKSSVLMLHVRHELKTPFDGFPLKFCGQIDESVSHCANAKHLTRIIEMLTEKH